MAIILDVEETSTITAKGQTTVPKVVRQALGVGAGDAVVYRVRNGDVTITRAEPKEDDPLVDGFLRFLAADIQKRPGALLPFSAELHERIKSLTGGSDIDLDAGIEGDVGL